MDELEKVAIAYLNKNKKKFLSEYTNKVKPLAEKIAIFTAGMSGVGKTELGIFLKKIILVFFILIQIILENFLNLLVMMVRIQILSRKLQVEVLMNFLTML